MAIRVILECGHASMLRTRTTPQGYTHDWEVFVRGVDNADISQYVDKVVFHLHETFPKPKRILKEPPYTVKESGYAGFVIPIDVYLKNKDEPKKIQISHDLILLPTGLAFNNVIRHHEVFVNPSEEFRKKLLKGGGFLVSNSEDSGEKGELKMVPPMVNKPKLSGTEMKKHRMTELRTSNSFADLFGNPMTLPAKVSPENKRAQSEKAVSGKGALEKTEKSEKPPKAKHSPRKDKKRDKSADDRKDKKEKVVVKEKDRTKEKSKRPLSPAVKEELPYPQVKKAALLSPAKKQQRQVSPSPSLAVQKSPSPKPKEKGERKKMHAEKEKDKPKEAFKMPAEDRKFDRKKKKHKDDRSKERKEKEKDRESEKTNESSKRSEKKIAKPDKYEKTEKEKSAEGKTSRDDKKSPKYQKEKEKIRGEKSERNETTERGKDARADRDKQKHKHKRKDKKDRVEEPREKEKQQQEKIKSTSEKKISYSTVSPPVNPLSTLLAELPDRDSSDSSRSIDEDSVPSKSFLMPKNDAETILVPAPSTQTTTTATTTKPLSPRGTIEARNENEDRGKREKTRAGRGGEERDGRRRKRKSESVRDEHGTKRPKERENSVSPSVEPVSSSQSPISIDIDSTYNFKETAAAATALDIENDGVALETEQVAPDSTNGALIDPESEAARAFSEDYVSQLKELQRKIMTLQDNQELQRVVEVIAETGQYEITKKTFDFDLCALDRRTVLRLQQFFAAS